jgi:hypothetical protein
MKTFPLKKGVSMRRLWNMTSRRIGRSLVVVALALCGLAAPAAADDQVPFTAEGTAVITSVTHLPGGLTQLSGNVSGTATHLGNVSGPITRVQDHQGNFSTTTVLVSANGTDSVFLAISGHFEKPKGGDCVIISHGYLHRDGRHRRVRQRHGEWDDQYGDRPVRGYRHGDL